jgi:hypothetical protein
MWQGGWWIKQQFIGYIQGPGLAFAVKLKEAGFRRWGLGPWITLTGSEALT